MSGLSLTHWLRYMGIHPWHAHQLANRKQIPVTAQCSSLLFEYAWQAADRTGRTEIRAAIEHAEQLIHQHAGRWSSPRFCESVLEVPRSARGARWLSLVLPEGEIRALRASVDSAAEVVTLIYTDEDGDGLAETATAESTVPTGTTAAQVCARFEAADCGPIEPAPEVAPRAVTIDGTTARLTFDAWALVRPLRYAGVSVAELDPNGEQVLATAIEVFRRRADPTGTTIDTAMAVLEWDGGAPGWLCCVDPAGTATAIARGTILDAAAGIISIGEAVYNSDAGTWSAACDWSQCRLPDRVRVRYLAGLELAGIAMQPGEAAIVARLAAAELARPVCACTSANKELYEWQTDLTRTGAGTDLFSAPADAGNPLGARRGQVHAWRHIQREQRIAGIFSG